MKFEILLLSIILFIATFFRVYHVDTNPPGLYVDEVSIGYNAYKILTTGRDEYGEQFPLFFKSFGDYKMPLYIYSVSASMVIFGKSEFAIRFPAILSGILSVLVLYFFLKELIFLDKKRYYDTYIQWIPYLVAFLLAISSWHLQFSRAGFEVTLACFLFLLGSLLMTLFWKTQRVSFLYVSFFLYVLTVYSYHIFRIIAPVTIVFLSFVIYKKFLKQRKSLLLSLVAFFLISLPLLLFSFSSHGSERFAQTSSFAEYKVDSLMDKFKTYPIVYLRNYLSFFSLDFLFTFGDGNGRHQVPGFGLLYRWQLPFLILGVIYLLKKKKSLLKNVVFFLLFVSPVAAAVARPSPQSLRDLLMVFPLMVITAFGFIYLIEIFIKNKKIVFLLVLVVVIFEFSMYLHIYFQHYPKVNINDWDAGYKQIIQDAKKYEDKYEIIVVDSNFNLANIYFLFYNEKMKPYFVNTSWKKPKLWTGKKVLLIRKFYEVNKSDKIIHNVYLPNSNKDIVSQFWDL